MLDLYINIRKRRAELGMSQGELAKLVGYTSKSTIARIEHGEIDLPQSKIVEFARALKTTPAELMGWTDDDSYGDSYIQDLVMWLSKDREAFSLIEKMRDQDYRDRLLQIVKLMGDK